jgi:uncharacterized metal-binding protein
MRPAGEGAYRDRPGEPMSLYLVTCSGISNTGRLTAQAAQSVLMQRPGRFCWVNAGKPVAQADLSVIDGGTVVVLDGCSDRCASRKCAEKGVTAQRTIMVTDLGIEKNGTAGVQFGEIQKVAAAVLDGGNGPV